MSLCNQCNAEGHEIAVWFNGVDINEGKFWCVSCWNAHWRQHYPAEPWMEVEVVEECDGDCLECENCEECDEDRRNQAANIAEGYDTEEEEAMAEQTGDYSYLEAHLKSKEDQKKKDDDKTK